MAIQSDSYQKINWGWLNDYNGYKFAPITFFEQLYTEEGYAFKDQYDKRWSDLEQGNLVAGAATSLKYPEFEINSDNEQIITGYKLYNTGNKNFPIYFKDGVPQSCDPSLLGNINLLMPEESKAQLQKNLQDKIILYEGSIERIQALQTARESLSSEEELLANFDAIRRETENLTTYQDQLRALTTIHGGTIVGDNVKFNRPLEIQIGNTSKTIEQSDSSTIWTHSDIGFADNTSGLLSTGTQTINGLKKFTSNMRLVNTERGYFLTTKDANNNLVEYAGIYDNGSNLWIGAIATRSSHHLGETYISTGYNETNSKGNDSVFICVPNEANDGGSIYKIIHTGNFDERLSTVFSKSHIEDTLRHNFEKSATGNYPSSNSERTLSFFDKTGITANDRLGAIRSLQSAASDSYNRNYMYVTAYSPKAETGISADFYIYVNSKGNAEAGVRATNAVADSSTSSYNSGNIVFMGAAWNDYAEFRDQVIAVEPGYCVASTDGGKVYKTTEKFQACDGIVSDTYGFAIGRSETYQTPLAVSGRVLAYCEGNRYDYHAGDTVCAGPEGKVCKMTREEIKEYPDRIVGIVSEIPEYEEWTGRKVNNRIWIKVK